MKGRILAGGGLVVGMPLLAQIADLTQIEHIAVASLSAALWLIGAYRALEATQAQPSDSLRVDVSPRIAHINDFYFGKIYRTENGESYCRLPDVAALAKYETTESFSLHMNRVLESIVPSRSIVLLGENTHSDFQSIIEKIAKQRIGKVVIRARNEVNQNVKTLECSVHLLHGTVHVRPNWAGPQSVRADEIIATLLVPLVESGLIGRLYLEVAGDLNPFLGSLNELIEAVLKLAGYPYLRRNDDRMSGYIQRLMCAQNERSAPSR